MAVPFGLNGGTLSTGSAAGFSDTVGALNLAANSTLALGTGNHAITFSGITGTPTGTLTISGWLGSAASPAPRETFSSRESAARPTVRLPRSWPPSISPVTTLATPRSSSNREARTNSSPPPCRNRPRCWASGSALLNWRGLPPRCAKVLRGYLNRPF